MLYNKYYHQDVSHIHSYTLSWRLCKTHSWLWRKIFAWGKLMSHRYRSLGKKEDANTKRTFRKRTMKWQLCGFYEKNEGVFFIHEPNWYGMEKWEVGRKYWDMCKDLSWNCDNIKRDAGWILREGYFRGKLAEKKGGWGSRLCVSVEVSSYL